MLIIGYNDKLKELIDLISCNSNTVMDYIKTWEGYNKILVDKYGDLSEEEIENMKQKDFYREYGIVEEGLISSLLDANILYRIDWNEGLDNINFIINKLLKQRGFPKLNNPYLTYKELETNEYLNVLHDELKRKGINLLNWSNIGDCYIPILIEDKDYERFIYLTYIHLLGIKPYFS